MDRPKTHKWLSFYCLLMMGGAGATLVGIFDAIKYRSLPEFQVYIAVASALFVIRFISWFGLYTRKLWGWRFNFFALYAIPALKALLTCDSSDYNFAVALFWLIYAIPNTVYFKKRKYLFDDGKGSHKLLFKGFRVLDSQGSEAKMPPSKPTDMNADTSETKKSGCRNKGFWFGVLTAGIIFLVVAFSGEFLEKLRSSGASGFSQGTSEGEASLQHRLYPVTPKREASSSGVSQKVETAADRYAKAAERGFAESQFNLGLCYENGTGIEPDSAKAIYWYTKAAEQGYAEAQYALGRCYLRGNGVAQDREKGLYWYAKAAEQGLAVAQCSLGISYMVSAIYNVPQSDNDRMNKKKALYWLTQAANQGYAKGLYELAECYYKGRGEIFMGYVRDDHGVDQDYGKAMDLYTKAAEQGYAEAMYRLGNCYSEGIAVPRDDKKAMYWYTKAARKGDMGSQAMLANIYADLQDYENAVYWYTQAACQGLDFSQFNLGRCYYRGTGVPEDRVEAYAWIWLANSVGGSRPYEEYLTGDYFTPAQIRQGQIRAKELQKSIKK